MPELLVEPELELLEELEAGGVGESSPPPPPPPQAASRQRESVSNSLRQESEVIEITSNGYFLYIVRKRTVRCPPNTFSLQ